MPKTCLFENGEIKFLRDTECKISANDAAANFGDGVYEVIAVINGDFVDLNAHMKRLKNSLSAVKIELPNNFGLQQIEDSLRQLLKENSIGKNDEGYIYFRVTRGDSNKRDFKITEVRINFYAEWHDVKLFKLQTADEGESALLLPDTRWFFKNVKTLQLMPSRLAKNTAEKVGADDVIFVSSKNIITEGGSTNLFIVKDNQILTHPADNAILAGITRLRLIELAKKTGYKVTERKFTVDELLNSDEVFRSSTSIGARGITKIMIKELEYNFLSDEVDLWQPHKNQLGEKIISKNKVGPITLDLAKRYSNYARGIQQDSSNEAA